MQVYICSSSREQTEGLVVHSKVIKATPPRQNIVIEGLTRQSHCPFLEPCALVVLDADELQDIILAKLSNIG